MLEKKVWSKLLSRCHLKLLDHVTIELFCIAILCFVASRCHIPTMHCRDVSNSCMLYSIVNAPQHPSGISYMLSFLGSHLHQTRPCGFFRLMRASEKFYLNSVLCKTRTCSYTQRERPFSDPFVTHSSYIRTYIYIYISLLLLY